MSYRECLDGHKNWACLYYWSARELASLVGEPNAPWEHLKAYFIT